MLSWSIINHETLIYSHDAAKISESTLWYNSDIRIMNKPFLYAKAHKAGLTQVGPIILHRRWLN